MRDLEILHSPNQWRSLRPEQVAPYSCVVIDVIRATSTIVSALANGARKIQPISTVEEAMAWKEANPKSILAGERGGQALPGFDLGNSPEDFTPERVKGAHIILTTTNGTRALAACTGAKVIFAAGMLNLSAVAARLKEMGPPWLILCAGCNGHFGVDDAVVAGALAEALEYDDSLVNLYRSVRGEMTETLLRSEAGMELRKVGLEKDVPFCGKRDVYAVVPSLGADGMLRG